MENRNAAKWALSHLEAGKVPPDAHDAQALFHLLSVRGAVFATSVMAYMDIGRDIIATGSDRRAFR